MVCGAAVRCDVVMIGNMGGGCFFMVTERTVTFTFTHMIQHAYVSKAGELVMFGEEGTVQPKEGPAVVGRCEFLGGKVK